MEHPRRAARTSLKEAALAVRLALVEGRAGGVLGGAASRVTAGVFDAKTP